MNKEESLIPTSKDIFEKYIDSIPSTTLSSELINDILRMNKESREEVRRITLEEAAEKARKQIKCDRTEEGLWKIMDSILQLNQSDRLKIS